MIKTIKNLTDKIQSDFDRCRLVSHDGSNQIMGDLKKCSRCHTTKLEQYFSLNKKFYLKIIIKN